MSNPNWVPVIGSSFDSVMGQQANWAGFNRGVEENNLARAAQAEEAQNRWRAQVAQMLAQDAARSDSFAFRDQEMAQRNQDRVVDFRENRRRFDIDTDLRKAGQKIDAERYSFARKERADEEKKYLDAIDRSGEHVSKQLLEIGPKLDKARADFTVASSKLEQIRSGLEKGLSADIEWRPSAKRFAPRQNKTPDPDSLKKMHEANASLELAQADYSAADNLLGQYQAAYADLQKSAGRDLQFGNEGGKHFVFSPLTNKRFTGTTPAGDFSWGDYDSEKAAALAVPPVAEDRSLTNFLFPGFNRTATNAAALGPAPVQQAARAITKRWIYSPDGRLIPAVQ